MISHERVLTHGSQKPPSFLSDMYIKCLTYSKNEKEAVYGERIHTKIAKWFVFPFEVLAILELVSLAGVGWWVLVAGQVGAL